MTHVHELVESLSKATMNILKKDLALITENAWE